MEISRDIKYSKRNLRPEEIEPEEIEPEEIEPEEIEPEEIEPEEIEPKPKTKEILKPRLVKFRGRLIIPPTTQTIGNADREVLKTRLSRLGKIYEKSDRKFEVEISKTIIK